MLYTSVGQQHPTTRQTNFSIGKNSINVVSTELHSIRG